MRSCAFLTMDNLEAFDCYDHLLYKPFRQFGWSVEEVSWRTKQVNWDQYEAVIIRSPWDYQKDATAFLQVLQDIQESSAVLENKLDLVEWNIKKTYLRDLEKRGIEIVPTIWGSALFPDDIGHFFKELGSSQIVIKPTISAGADNTFWLKETTGEQDWDRIAHIFKNRNFMVQPFMANIVEEGEFSLFFFGENYSHTILKTPKADDFRVQEEHGGTLANVDPEQELLDSAKQLLATLDPLPLYTRVDYVRTSGNSYALMELELIEPSLYFNMDPDSPQRFAQVFNEWMKDYL